MRPNRTSFIFLILFVILLGQTYKASGEIPDTAQEVTLTQEEADFVRWLIKNDKMVQELSKEQEALSWMNKIASATPGPIGVMAKWNMGTLKGWRMANQKLAKLKQQVTCHRIDGMIAEETKNKAFFERLYEARGCTDN